MSVHERVVEDVGAWTAPSRSCRCDLVRSNDAPTTTNATGSLTCSPPSTSPLAKSPTTSDPNTAPSSSKSLGFPRNRGGKSQARVIAGTLIPPEWLSAKR